MVELQLSQPAIGSGKLYIISSDPQAQESFISDLPLSGNLIELAVNEGDTKSGFRIMPNVDAVCQDRIHNFMLASAYGSMKSGDHISFGLIIQDNEAHRISFAEPDGSVAEDNVYGKDIQISIQPPASENIKLYVGISNYDGVNKYTTVPATNYDPIDGSFIVVDIPLGATSVSFKVIPKNNLVTDDDYDIGFFLYPVIKNCFVVPFEEVYQLTIIDDELMEV